MFQRGRGDRVFDPDPSVAEIDQYGVLRIIADRSDLVGPQFPHADRRFEQVSPNLVALVRRLDDQKSARGFDEGDNPPDQNLVGRDRRDAGERVPFVPVDRTRKRREK